MAKFALPIKSTYVPDWGVWECLREFVQNGKDEEDANGNTLVIHHSPANSRLRVTNIGADMDRSVLLLGQTSKAERGDLRGQFGEGLNLAILAGVRAGLGITIYTKSERWTASLEPAEEYGGAECLVIKTRKLPRGQDGVRIIIDGLDEGAWEEAKEMFIFLSAIPDNRKVRVEGRGSLLLEKKRKGCIYSKGVFVTRLDKFEYGYDLDHLKLDRDRRMVDLWDTQWTLGAMFEKALATRPELLSADVYRMLRDGAEDTKNFVHHASLESRDALAEHFKAEHGDDAVPVQSMSDSAKVAVAKKRGVVVNESLRDVLKAKFGTPDEIEQNALQDAAVTYAWSDLSGDEQAVLAASAKALDAVTGCDAEGGLGRFDGLVLDRVEVVDFGSGVLLGTCDMNTGRIRVARKVLTDVPLALRVLVHEEAHAVSRAGDGDDAHQSLVERIWQTLWTQKGAS